MDILLEFLKKHNYKVPDNYNFKEKVKQFFGILKNDERDVIQINHPKGYEILIKNHFIDVFEVNLSFIIETKLLEKGLNDLYNNRFVCYNRIIFNDDISAVTQILQDLKAIEDVVIYFDYEKNLILLNFALNNLDTNNTDIIYLEHIIFYNDKSRLEIFKRNLLSKIIEKNELFFIKLVTKLVEFWNDFLAEDLQKYIALAFMLDLILKKSHKDGYDVNSTGYLILNNFYVENDKIFQNFEDMNYYGFEFLTEYSKIFILLQAEK